MPFPTRDQLITANLKRGLTQQQAEDEADRELANWNAIAQIKADKGVGWSCNMTTGIWEKA